MGVPVQLERIGTDGDMEKAAQLYRELDGKVDAFGVAGTDLALTVGEKVYQLHSVKPMVRFVHETPIADGSGLKHTLESTLASFVEQQIGEHISPKRALIPSATDRWGMSHSFFEAGYDCVVGDVMFALGLPIPLRSERSVRWMAALIMPIASRLPFEWLYPTGEKQEARNPKWTDYFEWATVIAGDCNYITRYMPPKLQGTVIVTNTTTIEDVRLFRERGVRYLVTSTPVYDGRSFGTNLMEAALIAVMDKGRTLTIEEIRELVKELGLRPQLRSLEPT
jgi:hypothetical protein